MAARRRAKPTTGTRRWTRKRATNGEFLLFALLALVAWSIWNDAEGSLPSSGDPVDVVVDAPGPWDGVEWPQEAPDIPNDGIARPDDDEAEGAAEPPWDLNAGEGESTQTAASAVTMIAAARRSAGVPSLVTDPRLTAAAASHGDAMAAAGRCAHEGRGLEPIEDRLAEQGLAPVRYGEILACGAADAEEALRLWQRSKDHRAILLDPGFTEVGVGVAPDGEGGWYWTAVFAAGR